jgi:hypothetical protein
MPIASQGPRQPEEIPCEDSGRDPPGDASHKTNPSSIPQGTVDSYSTLPWVTWKVVTVVEGTR